MKKVLPTFIIATVVYIVAISGGFKFTKVDSDETKAARLVLRAPADTPVAMVDGRPFTGVLRELGEGKPIRRFLFGVEYPDKGSTPK